MTAPRREDGDSYEAGRVDTPLLDETVGMNFERAALAYPDVEALVDVAGGRRWTYAELNTEIDCLAAALIGSGIQRGDRVGVWSPNCPEWTIVQFATAKIGAILVAINPAYRSHELSHVLRHSGTRLLFSVTTFKSSDYRRMVDEVRSEATDLRQVVFLGTADWQRLRQRAARVSGEQLRARAAALRPSDPINIQYTSGTTGSPKGATLSHRNILNNGFFVTELIGLRSGDRLCIPVPFYHCFGMVMGNLGCTTHGATMVIPAPGFDPAATLAAVEMERCTAVYGVPTMFIAMLVHPDLAERDVSSLRTGIMAGASCPVEVMKRCVEELHMSRGVDRLWHDRNLAGVLSDADRRRPGAPHRDGGAGASARRGEGRRPGDRPDRAARSIRRAVHPRLLGDAGLLARG